VFSLYLHPALKEIFVEAIQATAPQHSTRDWEIQALDYGLGTGFSLVSSFFSRDPKHFCIIWDIISAQLKGWPDFLASSIFRIMSPQGIPPQKL
jgi:hypothetical protein